MTSPKKKISVIIPALNEARTIRDVLLDVFSYADEVVVVDDGSVDETGTLAKEAGASVIVHTKNEGYGASIEDGLRKAYRERGDVFVTFDADGQHRAEDIGVFADAILRGDADIVVGERREHVHFAEKIFMLYARHFGVRDPLCGLKAYSRTVYESIRYFETFDSIGTQLTFEAVKKGFIVKNIPIAVREREDTSRFYARKIRANLKILRALLNTLRH